MQIIEVISEKDKADFIKVPLLIYKDDQNWIRPLDKDINLVFDQKKNKYFRHGEAIRWLLKSNNKLIGRVAAFINRKNAKTFDQPTGGMGFFECINNKEAAFKLFDCCKNWLAEKGMQAMDGPINFGERDKWWGLLIDGFFEPTYAMNYNLPYYKLFFEDYGFKTYYEQYTYLLKVNSKIPDKFYEKASRVAQNSAFKAEHIKKNELKKYAEDFRYVYNKAWHKHDNFKGMSIEQALATMKTIKPIMKEELIWFAYYNNEPIAFFVILPELNQIFKHLNGKLNLIGKIKFLWYKWKDKSNRLFGVAFGVIPEYQGKGIEGFLIEAVAAKIQHKKYNDMELTWIGDFNPKMIRIVESLGATKIRTYVTYRKLFDESMVFKRAPIIG